MRPDESFASAGEILATLPGSALGKFVRCRFRDRQIIFPRSSLAAEKHCHCRMKKLWCTRTLSGTTGMGAADRAIHVSAVAIDRKSPEG
jgi:hypothetical protein